MSHDPRLIDRAFGPNLQGDTESLCMQMVGWEDRMEKEIYDADGPAPVAEIPMDGGAGGRTSKIA